jgi:hypothetical protein
LGQSELTWPNRRRFAKRSRAFAADKEGTTMGMEALTRQTQSEMLATYQGFRRISLRLNQRLVESLGMEVIEECARKLGMFRDGTFYFDTEDTAAVLMDYAIRHFRTGGRNAIERYLTFTPPGPPGSPEMTMMQAMSQSRYRLLTIEEIFPGFGLRVSDLLRDETGLLIDVGLSQTARSHAMIATHVQSPSDFWMATGAALPMNIRAERRLLPRIERRFGRKPEDFRDLSPEEETELATMAIRTCLEAGASRHVAYLSSDSPALQHSDPVPAPEGTQVGRNAPCPCGSRRKYKNCCRRAARRAPR